jgi:hypothetical protein
VAAAAVPVTPAPVTQGLGGPAAKQVGKQRGQSHEHGQRQGSPSVSPPVQPVEPQPVFVPVAGVGSDPSHSTGSGAPVDHGAPAGQGSNARGGQGQGNANG